MRQCRRNVFFSCTSQFREKNSVLPIEKFPILELARNTIMLQHPIIHFSLHQPSSGRLREVKYKDNFQTLSRKSGRGRLREVVAYKRFQI